MRNINRSLVNFGQRVSMPFNRDIIADYSLIGNSIDIVDGLLNLGVNGTFFNLFGEHSVAPMKPADLSHFNETDKEMWVLISTYSLYTMAAAGCLEMFTAYRENGPNLSKTDFARIIYRTYQRLRDQTADHTLADFIGVINEELDASVQIPLMYRGLDLHRVWLELRLDFIAAGLTPNANDWLTIGDVVMSQSN